MLKTLGNIFKTDLPDNTLLGTVIPTNTNNTRPRNFLGFLGFSFNKTLSNYTRYEKNANIFRSFIQIDTVKAKELNLSYFKTITINKFQNSKYSDLELGYTKLLNENQKIDLKNFILNDSLDRNFDLIRNDILGRELNLNEIHNKFSVENFASRKAFNYNSGLTVNSDLNISEYQDLFFECAFSSNLTSSTLFPGSTQYDLIIYAMNSNDEIIDVKKIEDFNTAEIRWNVDRTTVLYNIDDVDFDKLLNMSFDTSTFNNLRRKFYINITEYCKKTKQDLGFFPIENMTIQENSNPIELQLNNIEIADAFSTVDKIELNCNADLTSLTVPADISYKVFMKIAGLNSYVIKNFRHTILDRSAVSLMSQQRKLQDYLGNTSVKYLTNFNAIRIDLNLQNSAITDINFNPTISSIFINNDTNQDYVIQVFSFIPTSNSLPNLNLRGNLLKNIIGQSTATANVSTLYLRNYASNPINLKFVFEQDFEIYEIYFPIEIIYEATDYEQSLTIQNENFPNSDFSNLNIEYSIKIRNFKNSNTNLNRFLSLNYENIFLEELQKGKTQLNQDFENNIFVVIKKSIYQEGSRIKDKYYIFNKDISFNNIQLQLQTDTDLKLKLNFRDNLNINTFFFRSNQYDNVNIQENVEYKFEARIMIIPIGFFITQNDYVTKVRIKELLCLNNFQKALPSSNKINEIFQILKKINDNNFSSLNQLYLHKLYNDFCLKDTQAANNILILPNNPTTLNVNKLSFRNIDYKLFVQPDRSKILKFQIGLDLLLKNSETRDLLLVLNQLQKINLFNSIFFKDNSSYVNILQVIPEISADRLRQALNNNLSFTINVATNSVNIDIILNLNEELRIFFNFAYTRSTLQFSPYVYDFLNRNLYIKINIPNTLTNNSDTIEFIDDDQARQYCLLDFYSFLN